jgi:hypothetical protein
MRAERQRAPTEIHGRQSDGQGNQDPPPTREACPSRQNLKGNATKAIRKFFERFVQLRIAEKYCAGRGYPDLGAIYIYISIINMY